MYARKVIPILLIAGALMMFMRHKRQELMGQCEDGEQPTRSVRTAARPARRMGQARPADVRDVAQARA